MHPYNSTLVIFAFLTLGLTAALKQGSKREYNAATDQLLTRNASADRRQRIFDPYQLQAQQPKHMFAQKPFP
jgi:hypothetical protein